jgi:hypothetical protein
MPSMELLLFLTFLLGAACGLLTGWYLTRRYYSSFHVFDSEELSEYITRILDRTKNSTT